MFYNTKRIPMKHLCLVLAVVLASSLSTTWAQEEKDIEGGQDHPLLSRMPGFYMSAYETKDFDSYQSPYVEGKDGLWEGKLTKVSYTRKEGSKPVSMVQIVRNYEEAAKKIGGKVLHKDQRILDMRIQKNGSITSVEVAAFNDGRDYELLIVESKAMEQEVTANAEALSQSIAATEEHTSMESSSIPGSRLSSLNPIRPFRRSPSFSNRT